MIDTLPHAMGAYRYAEILAQRHSDIGFILSMVKREYGRAPSRKAVETMRAKVTEANAPKPDAFNCGHKRSFENTFLDGAYERCRTCRNKMARRAARNYRARKAA